MDADETARRLQAAGLLAATEAGLRTTPRWQAAVMRAAAGLYRAGDVGDDVRVPLAMALDEQLPHTSDDDAAGMLAVLVAVEAAEAGVALPRS